MFSLSVPNKIQDSCWGYGGEKYDKKRYSAEMRKKVISLLGKKGFGEKGRCKDKGEGRIERGLVDTDITTLCAEGNAGGLKEGLKVGGI